MATRSSVSSIPKSTLIFTIEKQTEKFVSVHNLFDIGKVYAAVQSAT
ncbi:MAG TPA: hypothetical protein VJ783_10500 [Pirellulales bacterium]|nr:hypothetical protein [Pirellulales bacterium]